MSLPIYAYFTDEFPPALRERGATVTSNLYNCHVAQGLVVESDRCTFTFEPKTMNVTVRHILGNWVDTPAKRREAVDFLRLWRKFDKQFKPDLTPIWLVVDATFYVTAKIDTAGWRTLLDTYELKVRALRKYMAQIGDSPLGPGQAAAYGREVMKTHLAYDFRKTKDHAADSFAAVCIALDKPAARPGRT